MGTAKRAVQVVSSSNEGPGVVDAGLPDFDFDSLEESMVLAVEQSVAAKKQAAEKAAADALAARDKRIAVYRGTIARVMRVAFGAFTKALKSDSIPADTMRDMVSTALKGTLTKIDQQKAAREAFDAILDAEWCLSDGSKIDRSKRGRIGAVKPVKP